MSQTLLNIFYQSHTGSWAITILLFVISYFLLKAGKNKASKIVHMILRLFYVIMIVSGIGTLIGYSFTPVYVVKGIIALVLIYAMEMILVRTKKGTLGQQAMTYWILFAITLIVVVLIGFGVITF
ncbi:DUF1516 family protein [Halalkalibacter suaedae]|uniref:UPF0344 protein J7W16_00625 n=1 Tax=Halalkalibacter suaedae TaxID=2822140 RepID=A0A941AM75_9BACI|nr:DUF1516 family protein [Bacillus suaedae]MBP3949616.1 DUF1516 family protein [Bacillus suaedae]